MVVFIATVVFPWGSSFIGFGRNKRDREEGVGRLFCAKRLLLPVHFSSRVFRCFFIFLEKEMGRSKLGILI